MNLHEMCDTCRDEVEFEQLERKLGHREFIYMREGRGADN